MIATLLVVNWLETKASEARLQAEIKASEARQAKRTDELREDMKELRADNRALGEKMDRLLETLLAAKKT